jgi:phosphoglycerate-specific signal transduction histidine kinase
MNETQQVLVDEEAQEPQETKPQNLESYLRDNIFGDDFRDYNDKLQKLTQEIEIIHQEISGMEARLLREISDVKAQYGNMPDNITQRVDNRIDELISRGENDLEKLSMLINEFATDFQAQIDQFRTETQMLESTNQIDRQKLADVLIEIATQLKKEL